MDKIVVRFWDYDKQTMIYGAGLSPNQNPIIQDKDGSLLELKGKYKAMLLTPHTDYLKHPLYVGDIVEGDMPYFADPDLPQSTVKVRGVMRYVPQLRQYIIVIVDTTKAMVKDLIQPVHIGNEMANPELLNLPTKQTHDTKSS